METKQEEILRKLEEGQLQYIRWQLNNLRDKSKHEESYFYNKSLMCFKAGKKYFNSENYTLSEEILLGYLKLWPNNYDAYFFLIRTYFALGKKSESDLLLLELLEWIMGEWNSALMNENSNMESAIESIQHCINKLTFFIEYVHDFYYAYKMRAKCFEFLGSEELVEKDFNKYQSYLDRYGTQKQLSWIPNKFYEILN